MDWTVKRDFKSANHTPIISLKGSRHIKTKPGQEIQLSATVKEPDGDRYAVRWWPLRTATDEAKLEISGADALSAKVKVPSNALPGQTYHLVLEVSDAREEPLTAYQLISVHIEN
jgi:hypothetical protein